MPIVESYYIEDLTPQADGRYRVYEFHVDHNGIEHTVEYLAGSDFDKDYTLRLRAENIGKEIDRREAAEQEALKFTVSLTKLQFLDRLTTQERIQCRAVAKTNPVAEDFMAMLDMAPAIRLGSPKLLAGLTYMESLGALATGRAIEIGKE